MTDIIHKSLLDSVPKDLELFAVFYESGQRVVRSAAEAAKEVS